MPSLDAWSLYLSANARQIESSDGRAFTYRTWIEFDEGTLSLCDAPETVLHAEWDDRVDTHRAQTCRYRALFKWAGQRSDGGGQATLDSGSSHAVEDATRMYPDLALTPALQIEPRDHQQAALGLWGVHDRQGTVVLPTDSGKTLFGLQVITDVGVSVLVVTPTADLMNQWYATLTHVSGKQLTDEVGALGGGCHDIGAPTVTTYDSIYRYIDEYGDRLDLLITDETHHLAAETYLQVPGTTLAPYRLGLAATYKCADGREALLEDRMGPVVYEEDVDALAGDFPNEYGTIQMSVDLTPAERTEYNEEYQTYRGYVDSHDSDFWKEQGYAEFLKQTSYDPRGRRVFVAKQRAERTARMVSKKPDTLDNLLKCHHDDRVIVLTANNDFTYDISRESILSCITHQTNTDERIEILDRFHSGEYSIFATLQVLDEGIDVPAANVGIILSGSASERQYAQRLGRILRPADDHQPAQLYGIITADTMEMYVSQRRHEGVSSSVDS